MITLTQEQQEIYDVLMEQIDNPEGKNIVISGSGGTGKALPNSTLIPTPNGEKRLDEIKTGDYIFDLLGNPTKVIGVFPQGFKENYEILFSDGRIAHSCIDHLWSTINSSNNIVVKPLSEILEKYKTIDNRGHNQYNYAIPTNHQVNFTTKDFIIDPYIIGVFLGDGNCREKQLTLSSKDSEIPKMVGEILKLKPKQLSEKYHWHFELLNPIYRNNQKSTLAHTNDYFDKYPEICQYSYDKSIPQEYLYGDIDQRKRLLQGLFDTDGSSDNNRLIIRFTSSSEKLIKQIRFLCYSLNLRVSIYEDKRKEKYTKSCFEMTISGPRETLKDLFRVKYKIEKVLKAKTPTSNFNKIRIRNINKLEPVEMTCLKVENNLEIFLTEDFVPTHNTTLICNSVVNLLDQGYKVAVGAQTGKATSVLRSKIYQTIKESGLKFEKDQLLIETVTKLTKQSKVLGLTESGETLYTNKWRDPRLFDYDVLFVDELSMIPQYISQWWQMTNARVFGFGDECQLPEVSTGEVKKDLSSFRHDLRLPEVKYVSGYGVKVLKDLAQQQLHKVLRSDNEIALLCGELRDFSQTKTQIVKRLMDWSEKSENINYSRSLSDIRTESDWQIICYTNKRCQEINNSLAIGTDYPNLLDKILLFDNLNPIQKYNGDTMLFGELLETIKKYNDKNKSRKLYVCMKWQGKMPRKDSLNPLERKFFNEYVNFKTNLKLVSEERLRQLTKIIDQSGRTNEQKDQYLKFIEEAKSEFPNPSECFSNIVERFNEYDLDLSQLIMDKVIPLPRLYMVTIDLGYAITTHKSQGSEYENVCYILERFDKPLLYTGLSRAKKKLQIIDLTKH